MIIPALSLGYRNLYRNIKRSIITFVAIAFATMSLVFFISLQNSAYDTSIGISTAVLYGNIQVQQNGFFPDSNFNKSFQTLEPEILKKIKSIPDLQALTYRLEAFGIFAAKEKSVGGKIIGVSAGTEKTVSTVPGVINKGAYFSVEDSLSNKGKAIIGSSLAHSLEINVGDEITLLSKDDSDSSVAEVLIVKGIFETGLKEADSNLIFIDIDYFREIFLLPNKNHSLVIKTNSIEAVKRVKNEISAILSNVPELKIITWKDLMPGLDQAIKLDVAISSLFYSTLLLVIGFTLSNTFIMSVLERKKEFAVLNAIGTSKGLLSLMLIFEGLILIISGVIIGTILGCILILYFSKTGFMIPGSEEVAKKLNINSVVYPWITFKSATLGPTIVFLIGCISLYLPSRAPYKIKSVEGIKN